jgi:hypothetical protein
MTSIVFTGPTLTAEAGSEILDARFLPPVGQGDVYRAALSKPTAIGIIDGYFQRVPAVWHKEILWAMSHGIHVFGAASMGALRAAELDAFGMEGVGSIYHAYKQRQLEDDDEVAVLHGPADTAFRPFSDAMVNIRATLHAAVAESVLSERTANAMEKIAKEMHFAARTLTGVVDGGRSAGLPHADLKAFGEWWPANQRNPKRDDAIEMLRVMALRVEGMAPKVVGFHFEATDSWEAARREVIASLANHANG